MAEKVNLKDVCAIDIHSHYNDGNEYDSPTNDIYQCDLDFLRKEYDASNIGIGCFSSFPSVVVNKVVYEENELAEKFAAEIPWFYQWGVIYPGDPRTYEQADRMLKNEKCIGIKIHAGYHQYSLEEEGDRIFSFAAERGATVLMHPDYLRAVPDFANKYRDCRIIVAHLGTYEHVECIEKSKWGNVYTDTSGSASAQNNIVEFAASRIGADRILFGTDTYSCGFQRGRIEYARLTDDEKLDILYRNALRMFPKLKFVDQK